MHLHVNPADELPIYRQIVRQVMDGIAAGRLVPGDKLASHRELAQSLVVAPLTVKKAYDELEREGYLATRRGLGSFVADAPPVRGAGESLDRLREGARRLAGEAWLNGVPFERLVELLGEVEAELTRERQRESATQSEETS